MSYRVAYGFAIFTLPTHRETFCVVIAFYVSHPPTSPIFHVTSRSLLLHVAPVGPGGSGRCAVEDLLFLSLYFTRTLATITVCIICLVHRPATYKDLRPSTCVRGWPETIDQDEKRGVVAIIKAYYDTQISDINRYLCFVSLTSFERCRCNRGVDHGYKPSNFFGSLVLAFGTYHVPCFPPLRYTGVSLVQQKQENPTRD